MSTTPKRTALITGAAGTLGMAVSRELVSMGISLALVDVNREKLEKAAEMLGSPAHLYALDISDADAVGETWKKITADTGGIDILVNNAGILSNNKLDSTTPEEWRRVLDVNLNGAFYLSRLAAPAMKARGWGRIVNVSSLAGKIGGITAGTAYSVSKGALIALTFALAGELAPYGVTVNAIAPAYIRTPMVTETLTEAQRTAIIARIPVGRLCEPEEFAHVVAFLVHERAGFITGEVVDQNGGLHFD